MSKDDKIYFVFLSLLSAAAKGMPFLQKQSSYPGVRKSGCLFCAYCYIAGFNTISQVDNAFKWAVSKGYVRESDAYCQLGRSVYPDYLVKQFGTTKRAGCSVKQGRGHFYVVDASGREVYNSCGLGCNV